MLTKMISLQTSQIITDAINFAQLLFKAYKKVPASVISRTAEKTVAFNSNGWSYRIFALPTPTHHRNFSVSEVSSEGSKSKCLHIVYDQHMAVVVPPKDVSDSEYLSLIRYIQSIKTKLNTTEGKYAEVPVIPCLVPELKVIFDKVSTIRASVRGYEGLKEHQIEKVYQQLFSHNPEFQQYLKIGDIKAFFMQLLSGHSFMTSIYEKLHNSIKIEYEKEAALFKRHMLSEGSTYNEVAESDEHIFDTSDRLTPVFSEVQSLIQRILSKQKKTLETYQVNSRMINEWVYDYIIDQGLPTETGKFSPRTIRTLFSKIETILNKHEQAIQTFLSERDQYLRNKTYKVYATNRMKGIAANLLLMLSYLKKRNVAFRDLKFPNLYATREPKVFGQPPFEFILGAIDLETAVDLDHINQPEYEGPKPAGTLKYAHLSNFMKLKDICSLELNAKRLYFMQDWVAVAGLIAETITGEALFKSAAEVISDFQVQVKKRYTYEWLCEQPNVDVTPDLMEKLDIGRTVPPTVRELYLKYVGLYKEAIQLDVDRTEEEHQWLLNHVTIPLTEDITELIQDELKIHIQKEIIDLIDSQVVFSQSKARKLIAGLSINQLHQCLDTLSMKPPTPQVIMAMEFFQDVINIKEHLGGFQKQLKTALSGNRQEIEPMILLQIMMTFVAGASSTIMMDRQHQQGSHQTKIEQSGGVEIEHTVAETIMSTIHSTVTTE